MFKLSLFLPFFCLAFTAFSLNGQSFQEVSADVGLNHRFEPANRISGGLAVFDYDGDGDDDVYVPGGRNGDALFENDGTGNFTEVGDTLGIREHTNEATTIGVVT
ncbi:MAG: FG-GAP-like repeat-containing protein, partial [Bacteroidota bacterium]